MIEKVIKSNNSSFHEKSNKSQCMTNNSFNEKNISKMKLT